VAHRGVLIEAARRPPQAITPTALMGELQWNSLTDLPSSVISF
jgi:hypothetical protein